MSPEITHIPDGSFAKSFLENIRNTEHFEVAPEPVKGTICL